MTVYRVLRASDTETAQDGEGWTFDAASGTQVPTDVTTGGGSSNLLVVSGAVTLDDGVDVGTLVGYRATGSTTFTGQGGSVALAAGAHIFERVAGGWTYRTIDEGTGLTPPAPDTTLPTAGTLSATATGTTAALTVTGAMDDIALHTMPYRFAHATEAVASGWSDAQWRTAMSAWQSAPTRDITDLTPSTDYLFRHEVRDSSGNARLGGVVAKATPHELVWSTLSQDDFDSAPDETPLHGFEPAVGSALVVTNLSGDAATVQRIVDGRTTAAVESSWQPSTRISWSGLSAFSAIRATVAYDHTGSIGSGGYTALAVAINGVFSNHLAVGVTSGGTVYTEKYGSGTLSAAVVDDNAPTITDTGQMVVEMTGTANGPDWTITVSIDGDLHSTFTFTGQAVFSTQARLRHEPNAQTSAVVGILDYKIETAT